MKITERYYPYPVLSYFDDNVEGVFLIENLDAVLDADKEHYTLKGIFETDNQDFTELIQTKKAAFVLHIECPKTRYRRPFHFFNYDFEVKIPTSAVEGKVELQPVIIVKENLSNYQNARAHIDYSSLLFSLRIGEVIAVAEPLEFIATKSLDSFRSFPSIFSISKNVHNPEKSMDINLENNHNKIQILLSEENYLNYRTSAQDSSKEPILASMLLLPAILTLFRDFNENILEYEERQWFPSIKRRVEECVFTFDEVSWEDDALDIAHRVIGDALKKGLNILANDGDDE
ncbi:hypothetical protein AB1L12_08690 [Peribacillus frigoritolerans]|uniref:hypothetical protein n=1 Tax=Peribacillus frigoritolerans TaxID=450367 RepID=UPI0039A11818